MDDIKKDLKEIKVTLVELVKEGAVHNHLLREHERRSLALEAKISPIEKHVSWMETVLKFGGAVLIGIVVQYIARHLL